MAMAELELDCGWTVNDVVKRHPATMEVFNRYGLDTCCGAMLTVEQAAHQDGVDTRILCAELHAAAQPQ